MSPVLRKALLILLLGASGAAQAHTPIQGIGNFYNGILHPLITPAHLLYLVALGLLMGQAGLQRLGAPMGVFAISMAAGLVVNGAAIATVDNPEKILLTGIVLNGVLAMLAFDLRITLLLLSAGVGGMLIGLDSTPDGLSGNARYAMLLGSALGANFCLLYIATLAGYFQKPWQRIGTRVMASWVTASSLLVIALSFANSLR